jgi:hypothetical protein
MEDTMLKSTLGAAALSLIAGSGFAAGWSVTVTNNLDRELLAPILITNVANDGNIFNGSYVTPEAEEQILTGDPGKLAARIGSDAMVGHGTDGPPGVLLAPGMSVTFDIETDATAVRVLSMVAPTELPDTYVTNVVDLTGADSVEARLTRFDIGHSEGTKMIVKFDAMMLDAMASDEAMAASDDTMATDTMASDDTMAMADDAMAPHPNAGAASIIFVKTN